MLILVGLKFWQARHKWRYYMEMGKQQFVENGATLVVRGYVSLTINIILSETVTEYSAVARTQ